MQVVLIAEQIVVRIKKNVKEGLYTKIQELKDAKQISIPQYNQNMESTKQLLEIIEDTFKKIESIISKATRRVSKTN
jgi:PAB1-binding protein PBP1